MKRATRLAALAALASAVLAVSADASPLTPVTISSAVVIGPFTGTWSASGAFTDAGSLVEPSVNFVGNGQLHIVRDVTGQQGTFTLRIDSTLSGTEPDGTIDFTGYWVILSGTGQYRTMHGEGLRRATLDSSGVVQETLTGNVYFD